jgi:hypothetical protein
MQDVTKAYEKTREDLIQYEDSEFRQLIANVPNFYISRNDQTMWGRHLRNVAAELGRLEFYHAYDIVGKDPRFLNPADAKRQWEGPLFINRNYPGVTGYDQDYKNLVIDLLKAYTKGATTASISAILTAYTGQPTLVEELFKKIGKTSDVSDRNTLKISVRAVGLPDSAINATNISWLQNITSDLYSAVDKAKPAHVGVDLGVAVGPIEDVSVFITGRFGITDELRIIAQVVEHSKLDDPIYQAPFLDGTTPNTGLASTSIVFFSPASGPVGQEVNVYGAGFTGATQVKVNDIILFPRSISNPNGFLLLGDGQLVFNIPVNATTGPVVISTPTTSIESPIDLIIQDGPLTYASRPGAVSPNISKVWEIKGEKLDTFNLD